MIARWHGKQGSAGARQPVITCQEYHGSNHVIGRAGVRGPAGDMRRAGRRGSEAGWKSEKFIEK
jgi:hypothetical protein